jgi:hypothetical protein
VTTWYSSPREGVVRHPREPLRRQVAAGDGGELSADHLRAQAVRVGLGVLAPEQRSLPLPEAPAEARETTRHDGLVEAAVVGPEVHVFAAHPRRLQAVPDRQARQHAPARQIETVLHPRQALLGDERHELAVLQDGGRGVMAEQLERKVLDGNAALAEREKRLRALRAGGVGGRERGPAAVLAAADPQHDHGVPPRGRPAGRRPSTK